MKITNFILGKPRFLILTGALLLTVNLAQAATTYNFTSAPFTTYLIGSEAYDTSGTNAFALGDTINTSLTFTTELAPNTTTLFHAESGSHQYGFDFFETPDTGGLENYFAQSIFSSSINMTSDIFYYATGPEVGGTLHIQFYSTVSGEVTTDSNGNISDWDLTYQLFGGDSSAGFVWVGEESENPGLPSPDNQNKGFLHIKSDFPVENTFTPIAINNEGNTAGEEFTYLQGDEAFGHAGIQYLYTSEKGSFAPVNTNTVPEPTSLMLLLFAGLSWLPIKHLKQKRKLG